MSTQITWEDPGDQDLNNPNWWRPEIVKQLKANPGKWAHVETSKATRSTAWTRYGLEAASRRQVDGTYKTYARWPEGDNDG